MARKRNTLIDDLLTIFSKLPWWAGVGTAIVAWIGFNHLAASFAGSLRPPHVIFGAVSGLAKWMVPAVCLACALASVLGRRKRARLLDAASGTNGEAAIIGMSWADFELLIGESFRRRGYTVKEQGGRGADGGIDLIATQHGQTTLVQCKHWKTQRVGVPVVREVFGVMTAESAAACWVVTSGRFTDEARSFAQGKPIKLVDGPALAELLREARGAGPTPPEPRPHRNTPRPKPAAAASPAAEAPVPAAEAPAPPACPRCSRPMIRRTATRGANAGAWFWGCSEFPRCRGTLDPG